MQELLLKLQFTKLRRYHLLPSSKCFKNTFPSRHQNWHFSVHSDLVPIFCWGIGVLCMMFAIECVVPSIVSETLDTALGCGFSVSDDYLQLWHCYCDYMRRRVNDWSEGNLIWVINHACMHQV